MSEALTPESVSVPRVTAGSCPHYLMFDAESVVRGDTRLKVAPRTLPALLALLGLPALLAILPSGDTRLKVAAPPLRDALLAALPSCHLTVSPSRRSPYRTRQVAPPLRDAPNRRKLWSALLDGTINMLSSDHTVRSRMARCSPLTTR